MTSFLPLPKRRIKYPPNSFTHANLNAFAVHSFLYRTSGCVDDFKGSLVIRPSGTEPKLKVYISVTTENKKIAEETERKIKVDLERRL